MGGGAQVIIDEADACEVESASSMEGLLRSFADAKGDQPSPQYASRTYPVRMSAPRHWVHASRACK